MFTRIKESWSMMSTGGRFFIIALMFLIPVFLYSVVFITRNLQGGVPEGSEKLTVDSVPSIQSTIRDADTGDGPVRLMSIAERAVLDRHFGLLGGIENIASVSSIRFSGTVTFPDGLKQEAIVVKKAGNKMRTTLKDPRFHTSWVISPDDSWRGVWAGGQLLEVRDMTEFEKEDSLRYMNTVSELFLAQQNGWELRYIGVREFNYKMAHVFEVTPSKRHTVRYFIEPKTFLDIGREDRIFEKDGTLNIYRRLHSEHMDANGMMLPGKVETYLNNELDQVFILISAELNPGILDSAFVRPSLEVTP